MRDYYAKKLKSLESSQRVASLAADTIRTCVDTIHEANAGIQCELDDLAEYSERLLALQQAYKDKIAENNVVAANLTRLLCNTEC